MKKLIAMTLVIVLAFSLCACHKNASSETGENESVSNAKGENQKPGSFGGKDAVDYTIHLNDYVHLSTASYWTDIDGAEQEVHEPRIYFDPAKFYEDHKDKVIGFYTEDDIMDVLQAVEGEGPFYFDYVEGYENFLEDGEVVHFNWRFNDGEVAKLKAMLHEDVEFVYEDFAFTVSVVPADFGTRATAVMEGKTSQIDMAAIEKKGIQLKDFVTIKQDGVHGKGVVTATLDKALLTEVAFRFAVDGVTKEDISQAVNNVSVYCTASEGSMRPRDMALSNGDKIQITTHIGAQYYGEEEVSLATMISVEIVNMETVYVVKGLPEMEPIDLSKNMVYQPYGGDVENGWTYLLAKSYFKLPTGENIMLVGDGTKADGSVIKIGDVVTVDFSRYANTYIKTYGEELFKSLTVDIQVEYLPYVPAGDQARDIFGCMDETCFANMEEALGDVLYYTMGKDAYNAADMTIERVGMMYYYMDKGNTLTGFYGNTYNQLLAIYKIVNADNPNGFYTFLGYNGDMYIHKEFDKATGEIHDHVFDINANHVDSSVNYYKNELPRMNSNTAVAITFEKNGVTYPGHESLDGLMEAIAKNIVKDSAADHLIVTDGLKAYVSEY